MASIVHQYPLRDVKVWELDSGREVFSFPMAASLEVEPLAGLQSRRRGGDGRDESGRRCPASLGHHDETIAIRHPASIPIPVDAGAFAGGFQPRRAPYCLRPELAPGGCLGRRRRQALALYPGTFGTAVAFSRDGRNLLAADPLAR